MKFRCNFLGRKQNKKLHYLQGSHYCNTPPPCNSKSISFPFNLNNKKSSLDVLSLWKKINSRETRKKWKTWKVIFPPSLVVTLYAFNPLISMFILMTNINSTTVSKEKIQSIFLKACFTPVLRKCRRDVWKSVHKVN